MQFLEQSINWILETSSSWAKPYTKEISFSFVATLLVIYGDKINAVIRKGTSQYQYFMRVFVFVLVSGFGYGMATSYLAKIVGKTLYWKTGSFLGVIVLSIFFLLGALADKKNHV